jgi:hypothetical protein
MERVLTQLTEEQLRRLRERSADSGQPMAALIREAVDAWLGVHARERRIGPALDVLGQFRSGLGDLADNHDRYVDDVP